MAVIKSSLSVFGSSKYNFQLPISFQLLKFKVDVGTAAQALNA
jgi:hypothetical protein